MMKRKNQDRRNGWASVFALVVLAVLSAFIAIAAQNVASARRLLRDRADHLQAKWLARAGLEITLAQLRNQPDYTGETIELLPGSKVAIKVTPSTKAGTVQIISEAQYDGQGTSRPRWLVTRVVDLAGS